MIVPDDLRYSKDHEWARLEGGRLRVGITHYAQDALGDIVYVGLPAIGATVAAAEAVGEVESTKSVSEIYAPVSGSVVAVNDAVVGEPELLNRDPYGDGWLFELEPSDAQEYDQLLAAAAYRTLIEG